MIKRLLSFDASSTTIGISLLELDSTNTPKLLHLSFYKPPKKGTIFERLAETRDFIKNTIKQLNPDEVCLEEIVLYMPNKTTAKTITTLAILNRCVGLAIYDELKKSPIMYSVMKIRHAIKSFQLPPANLKKPPKKEDIPELIATILKTPFPYEYGKKGKIKIENYDMADSVAVGVTHWLISTNSSIKACKPIKQPKIKKVKSP